MHYFYKRNITPLLISVLSGVILRNSLTKYNLKVEHLNYHIPVLLNESLEGLAIDPAGVYVDVTFGGGGHSRAILDRLGADGRLYGFDQDADAEQNIPDDPRFVFVRSNFRFLFNFARYHDIDGKVSGLLADLGVSSHHFDSEERGFSFRFNADLDMRMNQSQTLKASDIVNEYSDEKLLFILKVYGEVEKPKQVVETIINARKLRKIKTTGDLVNIVMDVIPERFKNKSLAKIFQALRIEVNGEMDALKELLSQSAKILKPYGRMAIITYHSLEDRLVKNFIRTGNFEGILEKDFYGNIITPFEQLNRKVITPSEHELQINPRSRSAKLRIAKRTVYEATK